MMKSDKSTASPFTTTYKTGFFLEGGIQSWVRKRSVVMRKTIK